MTRSAPVERYTWVEGSALAERDLSGMVAAESAWFAAHVAGLHGTFGAGLGLEAALGSDHRHVLVTPGFAVTATGQPVTLASPATIAAPAALRAIDTEAWDLVVTQAPIPVRGEARVGCTTPVPRARASLEWWHAGAVTHADPAPTVSRAVDPAARVVLARFLLSSDRLIGPDYSVRQSATVQERPHVASGFVSGSALHWMPRDDRMIATIDLTAGGFSRAPILHLWIKDHAPWPVGSIGAFASAIDVARRQAQIQLVVPGAERPDRVVRALTLGWMGMEPTRGCPATFTRAAIPPAPGVDSSLWSSALPALQGFRT